MQTVRLILLIVPTAVIAASLCGAQASRRPATPLSFHEMLEATPRELVPSKKLLSLNGRRVRIVGYMAKSEEEPGSPAGGSPGVLGQSSFYLCPHPVELDESGGGTGDLPPTALRIVVPGSKGQTIRFTPRALAVEGSLMVGRHVEADGQVSFLRLILDPGRDLSPPPAPRVLGSPGKGGVPEVQGMAHGSVPSPSGRRDQPQRDGGPVAGRSKTQHRSTHGSRSAQAGPAGRAVITRRTH